MLFFSKKIQKIFYHFMTYEEEVKLLQKLLPELNSITGYPFLWGRLITNNNLSGEEKKCVKSLEEYFTKHPNKYRDVFLKQGNNFEEKNTFHNNLARVLECYSKINPNFDFRIQLPFFIHNLVENKKYPFKDISDNTVVLRLMGDDTIISRLTKPKYMKCITIQLSDIVEVKGQLPNIEIITVHNKIVFNENAINIRII